MERGICEDLGGLCLRNDDKLVSSRMRKIMNVTDEYIFVHV